MEHSYLSDQMYRETEQEKDFQKMARMLSVQASQAVYQSEAGNYRELEDAPFTEELKPYFAEDFEILKLYMAVHATDCIRSEKFSGLPNIITENLKKQVYMKISKSRTQKDLMELMDQLLKDLTEAYEKYAVNAYSYQVQRAIEYIHSRHFQPVSAGDVAQALHMERTNLSKRFHKETGMTMTDYIHRMKMNLAEDLMQSRTYSMMEISDLLGYSSYNYFCKVYKKYKHQSPPKQS